MLLELISGALFSISANIDNIPIGISYGIKKIHIPIFKILLICLITSIVTFLSMYIGQNVSRFFNISIANIIGSILLILIGLYPLVTNYLFKTKIQKSNIENKFSYNNSYNITIKEVFVMTSTLCVNNIATGIAASITGVNVLYTTISTFIFGTIFIFIGNNLGKKINNKLFERYSLLISSLILILIGIFELFI